MGEVKLEVSGDRDLDCFIEFFHETRRRLSEMG
jgi:hypothetical protein